MKLKFFSTMTILTSAMTMDEYIQGLQTALVEFYGLRRKMVDRPSHGRIRMTDY